MDTPIPALFYAFYFSVKQETGQLSVNAGRKPTTDRGGGKRRGVIEAERTLVRCGRHKPALPPIKSPPQAGHPFKTPSICSATKALAMSLPWAASSKHFNYVTPCIAPAALAGK